MHITVENYMPSSPYSSLRHADSLFKGFVSPGFTDKYN